MEQLNDDDVFEQVKKRHNDGVYEQIKDFTYWRLTEKRNLLVDKLILDEESKNKYKEYGLSRKM